MAHVFLRACSWSPVNTHRPLQTRALVHTHLGIVWSQHMALFVSSAALRTGAKQRSREQLCPICAHSRN